MIDLSLDLNVLFVIAFLVYLVIIGVFAVRYIRWKIIEYKNNRQNRTSTPQDNDDTESRKEITEAHLRLKDLRRFGYSGCEDLENIAYRSFYINEDEYEALGIFVSLSPDIIGILQKVQHYLIKIETELESDSPDMDVLSTRITTINDSMKTLLDVTDEMTTKMYSIYSKASIDKANLQINPDVVRGYIRIAGCIVTFAFDYLNIYSILHFKISDLGPILEKDFLCTSDKFVRIFFVDLMECINMLDKSIEVFT